MQVDSTSISKGNGWQFKENTVHFLVRTALRTKHWQEFRSLHHQRRILPWRVFRCRNWKSQKYWFQKMQKSQQPSRPSPDQSGVTLSLKDKLCCRSKKLRTSSCHCQSAEVNHIPLAIKLLGLAFGLSSEKLGKIRPHRLSVQGVLLPLLASSSAFPLKQRAYIALLGGGLSFQPRAATFCRPAMGIRFLET